MQTLNSTLQYSEAALAQRGSAEVDKHLGIPVQQPATRQVAEAYAATSVRGKEVYRFPGATPERQRVRRPVPSMPQARTQDAIREQQISSAVENAYNQFTRREQRQLTPQEVSVYAQWILQANRLIESMRFEAERGE